MKMNLANKLTFFRIILIPVFLLFVLSSMENALIIACAVFILASITDFLDGYIARKYDMVTNLGKFLDPMADKLLVTSAMVSLVELGMIPSWMVIVIISREFIVSIFRAVAAAEGIVIAASWWGKAKTVSQMIALIVIMLSPLYQNMFDFNLGMILMWIATILTIISGTDYIIKNKHVLK
jgi:CDP-diacylglycerol--glycerol-3-phosphate 3-phosphatidyltransferase